MSASLDALSSAVFWLKNAKGFLVSLFPLFELLRVSREREGTDGRFHARGIKKSEKNAVLFAYVRFPSRTQKNTHTHKRKDFIFPQIYHEGNIVSVRCIATSSSSSFGAKRRQDNEKAATAVCAGFAKRNTTTTAFNRKKKNLGGEKRLEMMMMMMTRALLPRKTT